MGKEALQGFGFVMHAEPIHQGGAGFVEAEDFDFRTFAAELQHDFVY